MPDTLNDGDDVLDALDFEPEPQQCECVGRCTHHVGQCPHNAQFHTKVHAFGVCRQPGLTADGCAVQLVCAPCMFTRAAKVGELVAGSHRARHTLGQFLHCGSCARPIADVNDLWEVRLLADV